MNNQPLDLIVFDETDRGLVRIPRVGGAASGRSDERFGLSSIWWLGSSLHDRLHRVDGALAARSWSQALRWAIERSQTLARPIRSLQAWGHGGWGSMRLGADVLDSAALSSSHELASLLDGLAAAFSPSDAFLWLRCCSAFGRNGTDFARHLADRLACRVVGHTHIIGFFQSGLHSVRPGEAPGWSATEGVRMRGGQPLGALGSSPLAPNTITALRLFPPRGW